ncbi:MULTISPECIES: DUF6124 family protein [Pseudomonas]|uniref:DUF3077 domain-containing protein n=1 Tax=Pseudomonas farsensis TaxID=2745492 RepID=A0ABU8QME2_9PSED|nr:MULTISPECIES: DUF3077 domain-containing protein [Pseudomonas]MBC3410235.1 DUF3077 domain-containing protein [Pseudomonas sp. SWRI51]MBV4533847.1 DUF3077 domain-containing protein [Pseudomonas farsensis]
MNSPKKTDTELDSEAARRALDYYLNPPTATPDLERSLWTLRDGVSREQAMEHALELLRCAAATAQETAAHQQGTTREVVFALMHMTNMARALLEQRHAMEQD